MSSAMTIIHHWKTTGEFPPQTFGPDRPDVAHSLIRYANSIKLTDEESMVCSLTGRYEQRRRLHRCLTIYICGTYYEYTADLEA